MKEKIKANIEKSEKVLIGIGEAFQEQFCQLHTDSMANKKSEITLESGYQRIDYLKKHKDEKIILAYRNLKKLIDGKDYYLISTCTDDRVYQFGFDSNRIVTPCGGFRYLQCSDNCKNELLPVTDEMIQQHRKIKCPYCGKEACFNQLPIEKYNENGYLSEWNCYNKWLQNTLNKEICILELGVGMKYPTVIRWPFEKIAFINKKASFYRIHETLYQSTNELKQRCISVPNDPVLLLGELFE